MASESKPEELKNQKDISPDEQNIFDCPICTEFCVEPQVGECGHTICIACKRKLEKNECPFCRKKCNYAPNYALKEILQKLKPKEYREAEDKLFKINVILKSIATTSQLSLTDSKRISEKYEKCTSLESILILASKTNDIVTVRYVLSGIGIPSETTGLSLSWAAYKGNAEIAKMLIENKANIDYIDNQGNTTLHYAIFIESLEITRLLVQNGANVELESFAGTPLADSCKKGLY